MRKLFAMPIDWDTTPDGDAVGEELLELMRELYPLPRSLTGDGVRETLAVLGRDVPLEVVEVPSGEPVFDWTVPREWTIRGGWIEAPDGMRVVDFADSTLHVLGYSTPVDTTLGLDELREHVFTHPDDPELVPYRTSYWEERWGFCMSRSRLESLERRVPRRHRRDARRRLAHLRRGARPRGDRRGVPAQHLRLPPGARQRQPLGGRAAVGARADAVASRSSATRTACSGARARSGRSAGSRATATTLDRVRTGSRSRASATRALCATSAAGAATPRSIVPPRSCSRERHGSLVTDWSPLGGDERQYCSPGFDLPVGTFSRTPHGLFPEYHSSADNLDLVTAPSLGESFRAALELVDAVETNAVYRNRSPYGEPQLGKRGLYQSVPDGTYPEAPLLWVLSLSDGAHDLLAIAEHSGLPYRGDPRGGRDARATRAPRASAVSAGPVAIVTGASRGIGRADAVALAEAGFAVGLVARTRGGSRGDASPGSTSAARRRSAPPPTSPTPRAIHDAVAAIEERSRRPDHGARQQRGLAAGDRSALGGRSG